MDFNLQREWGNVSGAPVTFVASFLIFAALVWLFLYFLKRHQVGDLESRLKLRDDEIAEYKRKLDGATPDEAHARIGQLEERVAALTPRQRELSEAQRAAIAEAVNAAPPGVNEFFLVYAQSSLEAAVFADQIAQALRDGGWDIDATHQISGQRVRKRGLNLAVQDVSDPGPIAAGVASGLRRAGIPFGWEEREVHNSGILYVDIAEKD
jgi:hypothetical protein